MSEAVDEDGQDDARTRGKAEALLGVLGATARALVALPDAQGVAWEERDAFESDLASALLELGETWHVEVDIVGMRREDGAQ